MLSTLFFFFCENLCTKTILTKEQETLHVLRLWSMIRSDSDRDRHHGFTEAVWYLCFEHWITAVAYQKIRRQRFAENRKIPCQVGVSLTSKVKRANLIQFITQNLDCDFKVMLRAYKVGQILLFNRDLLKGFARQYKLNEVSISACVRERSKSFRDWAETGGDVKVVREKWKPFLLYLSSQ